MKQIDKCVDQLIDAILASAEYQQYQEIRNKVKQEPEKERAIHEFRKRNYMIQKNKENKDLFELSDQIEREYAQFRTQPLVDEYLAAELAVCRLIQKINWKLVESVEFDLGFFDQ